MDTTRHRDLSSEEEIQGEIDISRIMIVSSANSTGSPFTIIKNDNNQVNKTAQDIVSILVGK